MSRTDYVYLLSGATILLSVALGYAISTWCYLPAMLVGADLFQSAFTGFCPLERLMARLGVPDRR